MASTRAIAVKLIVEFGKRERELLKKPKLDGAQRKDLERIKLARSIVEKIK